MNDEFITVRIPRDCWDQLVSDYENMCGTSADEIEILRDAYVVEDTIEEAERAHNEDAWLDEQFDDDGPGDFEYDNWDYVDG